MTRTRRWLCGLLGATLLTTAFPIAAQAQSDEPPAVRQNATDTSARLETAKSRITAEIEKRLTALERLSARVVSARHVTAPHAATLLDEVVAADATLSAGVADIATAATLDELRAIAAPLFEETLVFALLVPKTKAVIAADAVGGLTDRYEETAANLQSELDRLAAAGIDINEPQTNLDNARRIVADVAAIAAPVADSVIDLQPGDDFRAPLNEAISALRGVRAQLHEAKRWTRQVVAFVRNQTTEPTSDG